MGFAIERAHAQGLEVKKIEFTDWITPNEALAAGDIDANLFQHIPFLNAAIKARGYKLVPIAATTVMPMALFSHKVKSLDEVAAGVTVAIANDPVNGARGLRLFEKGGLIALKPRSATTRQWRISPPIAAQGYRHRGVVRRTLFVDSAIRRAIEPVTRPASRCTPVVIEDESLRLR